MQHPFDQAFNSGTAPPAEDMMTNMPTSMNNHNGMVPYPMMAHSEQSYINNGTIIDQAFKNGSSPSAEGTMTMEMTNPNQMVPNVMMDMPEQFQQQQNVTAGFMDPQGNGYAGATQPQAETYDLNKPPFDIEDPLSRRQFFRKVFTILIIQHLCAIPIMEIILFFSDESIDLKVGMSFGLLSFLIFIAMYIFSDYRRHSPVNYMALVLTTFIVGIQTGISATYVGQTVAIVSRLTVVAQLAFTIAFSKQSRFRFSNGTAFLFTIFMYLILQTVIGLLSTDFPNGIELWIAFAVVYYFYDMQLMLSGHHGYNLKADEHIFGATNIYADIPNLIWRFFRYIFLDHFIRAYQWLSKTCSAEIC